VVKTTEEMDNLVCSVNDVIFGRIDVTGFYARHLPANKYGFVPVVDREGFVVYDVDRNNSYGKIKVDAYYMAHKFHKENVAELIKLGEVAGDSFPLARDVANTFKILLPACKEICGAMSVYIDTDASVRSDLPEKARVSLDKMNSKEKQYRLIIFNARAKIGAFGAKLFCDHFPALAKVDAAKFDVSGFAAKFAMNTRIWEDKSDGAMVLDDTSREELIAALFM
jgi:hypothetical protein